MATRPCLISYLRKVLNPSSSAPTMNIMPSAIVQYDLMEQGISTADIKSFRV